MVEALTSPDRTPCIIMYKNNARSRLFLRIAKRSTANRCALRCQQKKLILLSYKICPCLNQAENRNSTMNKTLLNVTLNASIKKLHPAFKRLEQYHKCLQPVERQLNHKKVIHLLYNHGFFMLSKFTRTYSSLSALICS